MAFFEGEQVFQKAVLIGLGVAALALPAAAQTFSTYDDAKVVSPGDGSDPTAFQLTSSSAPGMADGGLEDKITSALPLSQLTTLSADYDMTTGPFAGGAPRFTLFDSGLNSAWVYWGTPTGGGSFSNPNSAWANTGNYADLGSADVRVYSNGFGGVNSPNTGMTWSQFVGLAGSTDLSYVTLDLDGGWANSPNGQQMLVDNFTVNSQVFDAGAVPEPTVWSMLILGVAGIGTALRLRPKRIALA